MNILTSGDDNSLMMFLFMVTSCVTILTSVNCSTCANRKVDYFKYLLIASNFFHVHYETWVPGGLKCVHKIWVAQHCEVAKTA